MSFGGSGPHRYTLQRQIGQGQYARVWEALDNQTMRRVAVKVCVQDDETTGISYSTLREISLLRELNHPNILALLDVVIVPGNHVSNMDTDMARTSMDQGTSQQKSKEQNDVKGVPSVLETAFPRTTIGSSDCKGIIPIESGESNAVWLVLEIVATNLFDALYGVGSRGEVGTSEEEDVNNLRVNNLGVNCLGVNNLGAEQSSGDNSSIGQALAEDPPGRPLGTQTVQSYAKQLLLALAEMHRRRMIHRDVKPTNLLLDGNGGLKLADFGLARPMVVGDCAMTAGMVTLIYRSPEMLMGTSHYGPAVDIWAAGCVMGEMVLGKPLFVGDTEMEQLTEIFRLLGPPDDNRWPNWKHLPDAPEEWIEETPALSLRDLPSMWDAVAFPREGRDLVMRMLEYDPQKRITAQQVCVLFVACV